MRRVPAAAVRKVVIWRSNAGEDAHREDAGEEIQPTTSSRGRRRGGRVGI